MADPATIPATAPLLAVTDAAVRFGEVTALDGVSLSIAPGECIGLVGHNGAGKSTIVSVINGGLTPQRGQVSCDSVVMAPYGIARARAHGVRCVFQELSLCPNLTIVENTRIMHRSLNGPGWRRSARRIVEHSLDAVFPGHGISSAVQVGSLSIAQRQMVEIAVAFSDAGIGAGAVPNPETKAPGDAGMSGGGAERGAAARLVILDEPTSSLDAGLARQLLAHVRRFVAGGGSVILISHILDEILDTADRIVVMKDAKIVAERPAAEFGQASLVAAMGSAAQDVAARGSRDATGPAVLTYPAVGRGLAFRAARGEVIGLAGLGGHGQTDMLLALFARLSPNWRPRSDPAVAFVAGDRRENGVFDLWSIARNLTIGSLGDLSPRGLLNSATETARSEGWKARIGIRTPDMNNRILSLSGGNQQKVLFARALSTRAPAVLMDDPMRGVDVGTKHEVYRIIRSEADAGRTFVWYSTEMDEMALCDRVYVFREGVIVAELVGADISEKSILQASFSGTAAVEGVAAAPVGARA